MKPDTPRSLDVHRVVLRHLIKLEIEYRSKRDATPKHIYVTPPTTKQVAEFLGCTQATALKRLNEMEMLGQVRKSRRLSAGTSGYGWDGSLYSEVHPTERAMERYAKKNKAAVPFTWPALAKAEWLAVEGTFRLNDPERVGIEVLGGRHNVRTLFASVREKTGCETIEEVIELAVRHGLPPPPNDNEL